MTAAKLKLPSEPEVTVWVAPVSTLVSFTLAPGKTAPVESSTLPPTRPVSLWACRGHGMNGNIEATRPATRIARQVSRVNRLALKFRNLGVVMLSLQVKTDHPNHLQADFWVRRKHRRLEAVFAIVWHSIVSPLFFYCRSSDNSIYLSLIWELINSAGDPRTDRIPPLKSKETEFLPT